MRPVGRFQRKAVRYRVSSGGDALRSFEKPCRRASQAPWPKPAFWQLCHLGPTRPPRRLAEGVTFVAAAPSSKRAAVDPRPDSMQLGQHSPSH